MISIESFDAEDWNNDVENVALHHRNKKKKPYWRQTFEE